MRTKNSLYNIVANVGTILVQTILVFAVRIIFTRTMEQEYLGIQGLLTNIISMLSIAELGIGSAICYSLYEPIANKNIKKISQIVTLLKKIYYCIALIILISGIFILPFLKYIATDYNMGNLDLILIIYLFSLAFEYFTSYPEILIIADQKKYKVAIINLVSLILINIFQIMILIYTKNFILYILCDTIIRCIKFVVTNLYIKKQYKNINFNCKEPIGIKTKKDLIKNIKSLFLCKIGDYLISSTDNIIISKIINVVTVGIYGNYLSIVVIFKNIVYNIMLGITSSFGNLVVKEDGKTQENVFNIMNFVTYVFTGYIFVCLFLLFNPFIELCFGTTYLLDDITVMIICLNFYLINMVLPVDSVKNAAGLYYRDRYVPLIQAIINLGVSIILAIKIGLIGVLIGTTVSYLLVVCWEKPYMIYKYAFKTNVLGYYKNYIKNILLISIITMILKIIIVRIGFSITILNFILCGLLISIIYFVFIILTSYNKKELRYIYNVIKTKVGDIRCKN